MARATQAEDRESVVKRLKEEALQLRITDIKMLVEAGSGHPGGTLSAADMIAALYFYRLRLRPEQPEWPDRDRFVLSKGHCVPIVYAALARRILPGGAAGDPAQVRVPAAGTPRPD